MREHPNIDDFICAGISSGPAWIEFILIKSIKNHKIFETHLPVCVSRAQNDPKKKVCKFTGLLTLTHFEDNNFFLLLLIRQMKDSDLWNNSTQESLSVMLHIRIIVLVDCQ